MADNYIDANGLTTQDLESIRTGLISKFKSIYGDDINLEQNSPDGQWILLVGSGAINTGESFYYNTDIFVCRIDGTELTQLTYHAADDLSPVWSRDGKFIYFISQRGSSTGTANIWKMNFSLSDK